MKNNEINGTTITALEVDAPELVKMMNEHAIMAARSIGFKRIGEAGGYVFSLLEEGDL